MRFSRGWAALLVVLAGQAIAPRGVAEPLPFTGIPLRDDGGYIATTLPDWPPTGRGLTGTTVVLDPGHGGRETGTQGPAGLLEKDVNLAVALETARLLRETGAHVLLTRESDTGVAAPGSPLAADLEARAMIANRASADLFVSIHHNASMDPSAPRSQTETYYRIDDPGPSREAAESLHGSLADALGLTHQRLSPGFYAVLRHCHVPAVLGEASYLTHPFTESRLRTPEGPRLEALAYARGIARYLAPGVPVFEIPSEVPGCPDERPVLMTRVRTTGATLDRGSVVMTVDGDPVATLVDLAAGEVRGYPGRALAQGVHLVAISGRNVAGRTAVPRQFEWRVSRPPARIEVRSPFAGRPAEGPLPLEVRVLDRLGFPVSGAPTIQFEAQDGWTFDATRSCEAGWAGTWLMPAGRNPQVTVRAGTLRGRWVGASRPWAGLVGWARDASGSPLPGLSIFPEGAPEVSPAVTDRNGAWWFPPRIRRPGTLRLEGPGLVPTRFSVHSATAFMRLVVTPESTALPTGTRIILDPAGGPESLDPNIRSKSLMSHRVAELLKQYITIAGGEAILTRGPDSTPADLDRIRLSTLRPTFRYLRLAHGNGLTEFRHYPRSLAGEDLARRLARELACSEDEATPSILPAVRAGSELVLIHPPCPSVIAQLPPVRTDEEAWRQARACFQALQPVHPQAARIDLRVQSTTRGPTWSLTLDGRWPGRVRTGSPWSYGNLAPGVHRIQIRGDDGTVREVVIPSLAAGETRKITVDGDRPEIDPHLATSPGASPVDPPGKRIEDTARRGG